MAAITMSASANQIVQQDWRSELAKKYIKSEGLAGVVIQSYDHQYVDQLLQLINNAALTVNAYPEEPITFDNACLHNPSRYDIDQRPELLTPNFCRLHGYDYRGRLTATAKWRGRQVEVFLGHIPIMIRSRCCNTRGMSDSELMNIGECPNDPGGYFVVGGSEKIIVTQERTLPNKILTYMAPSGEVVTEMKATAPDGRKVRISVSLIVKDNDGIGDAKAKRPTNNILKAKIPFFGEEAELNLFALFELLGELFEDDLGNDFHDPKVAASHIIGWVDGEDNQEIVKEYLMPTIEAYKSIADHAGVFAYVRKKLKLDDKKRSLEEDKAEILHRVRAEAFANMRYDEADLRIEQLAMMTARFVETVTGIRGKRINQAQTVGERNLDLLIKAGLDDRDSLTNKMGDAAGTMMAYLTSQAIRKLFTDLKEELDKRAHPDPLREINSAISLDVLNALSKAIRQDKWQMPGGVSRVKYTGVTRTLQRESIVGAVADIRSLNAPIPRKSHNMQPRSVQLTYWAFICSTSTKEGEDCGLAKSLALGAGLSLSHPTEPIEDFLAPYIHLDYDLAGKVGLMFNGRFKGWVYPERLIPDFISARRNGLDDARAIPEDVSISIDLDGVVQVMSTEGRFIRPVLVVVGGDEVEEERDGELVLVRRPQELVIDQKQLRGADIATLKLAGALELLDASEQQSALIAVNPADLNRPINADLDDPTLAYHVIYTHCELDPQLIQSLEANTAPFGAMQPGTRGTYQANMAKHAVGINHLMHRGGSYLDENGREVRRPGRFESSKQLAYPQKPIVTTDIYDLQDQDENWRTAAVEVEDPEQRELIAQRLETATSTNLLGVTGQNATVAILSGNPAAGNEEDSMMLNARFVDLGGFMTTTYKSDTYEMTSPDIERLGIPPNLPEEQLPLFSAIDPVTSVARPGAVLTLGMAIVAKYEQEGGRVRDTSIYLTTVDTLTPAQPLQRAPYDPKRSMIRGEDGQMRPATRAEYDAVKVRSVLSSSITNTPIMDEFYTGRNAAGKLFIKYKYRITRRPQVGDKFASRFSQKGIVGMVVSPEDMPFNDDGISPDIIINPHAFPSRMTIGHMIESITGKAGALLGEQINGTIFRDVDHEELKRVLQRFGYSYTGSEHFTDGVTGQPLQAMVFNGPVFYQVLRHMVEDKKRGRARGNVHHLWRQPTEGRSRGGGLRLGEMERDCMIAHRAAGLLQERYCKVSDPTRLPICRSCGQVAIANPNPPYNFAHCSLCRKSEVPQVTVPNSLRLLYQFNAAMGVKLSIRTQPTRGQQE